MPWTPQCLDTFFLALAWAKDKGILVNGKSTKSAEWSKLREGPARG